MAKKYVAQNSSAGVHGRTIINHKVRSKVNISCNEYVIMDFIMNLFFECKKPFDPKTHEEKLYKAIGCYFYQIEVPIQGLITKGLLSCEEGLYLTTEKWDQHFNHVDVETEFAELWNKYGAKGNRKTALNYYRTLKKEGVTYEHIDAQMDIYLEFIKLTDTYIMHLSSFLSPGFKKYDDECYKTKVDEVTAQMQGSKIETVQQETKFTL
jgi:hypothetical protein